MKPKRKQKYQRANLKTVVRLSAIAILFYLMSAFVVGAIIWLTIA